MDLKKLLGLRPKTDTLPDIEAALDRASAALTKAREEEAGLLNRRPHLLLGGDADSVAAAEGDLARVRLDIERAEVMTSALKGRLAEVLRETRIARLRAKIEDATAKAERAKQAIGVRYPELAAAMVREVLAPEAEALAAIHEAFEARETAIREGLIDRTETGTGDAWALPAPPLLALVPSKPHEALRSALGPDVALPAVGGRAWPAGDVPGFWPATGK